MKGAEAKLPQVPRTKIWTQLTRDAEAKLHRLSKDRITELNKQGVAQGLSDISEPDKKQYPILIDMDKMDSWMTKAKSFAIDRRLKGNWDLPPNYRQIDVADIFQDIQSKSDNKSKECRKVIILGSAGIGKTVLLRWLAAHDSLKDKLVLVPELRNFSADEKIRPSHALLSSLFADMDKKEMEFAFQWIKENSDKIAIIIDSLDTMPFDLHKQRPVIDNDNETTIDVIAHNLLSGNLLPGSLVISSSREYKVKDMHRSVQPDRCVVIDGLTEESVEYLIGSFLGNEKGQKFTELIKNACPNVWPWLSIPIVLMFTIISYANDADFIPSTLAAIQVNYFINLVRSKQARVQNIPLVLRKLMPMCLDGIRKESVLFTPNDLKLADVTLEDASDLGIFIPQGHGRKLSSKLMHNDRFFLYFSHQTQQECLAALHVISMDIREFEKFVEVELNQPNFIVVRRLVYGISLNASVFDKAMELFEIEISDLDAKRDILKKSLRRSVDFAFSNGQPRDIVEVCADLTEVNDGVAELIRPSIRKIILSRYSLRPSDVQAIASVMKECEHLGEVNIDKSSMDDRKMDILTRTVIKSKLKIDHLDVSNNVLGVKGSSSLAKVTSHCGVNVLNISECQLETEHLEAFQENASGTKFSSLNVEGNDSIGPKGWRIIGSLVQDRNADLNAYLCDLNDEKVKNLGEGMGGSKLSSLHLRYNGNIGPKGWRIIGGLMQDRNAGIDASRCDLNDEKVKNLGEGMGGSKLSFLKLWTSPGIGPEEWRIFGGLMEEHSQLIDASDCNFNDEKVKSLCEGMGKSKVDSLDLRDYMFRPPYTSELLNVLPHVRERLHLLGWISSNDEVKRLQSKLNEISSSKLVIKTGRGTITKNPTACPVDTTPGYDTKQPSALERTEAQTGSKAMTESPEAAAVDATYPVAEEDPLRAESFLGTGWPHSKTDSDLKAQEKKDAADNTTIGEDEGAKTKDVSPGHAESASNAEYPGCGDETPSAHQIFQADGGAKDGSKSHEEAASNVYPGLDEGESSIQKKAQADETKNISSGHAEVASSVAYPDKEFLEDPSDIESNDEPYVFGQGSIHCSSTVDKDYLAFLEDSFRASCLKPACETATITPQGGSIELYGYMLLFPAGAVHVDTDVELSIHNTPNRCPKSLTPISLIIGCKPSKFKQAVKIRLTSWFRPKGGRNIKVVVLSTSERGMKWKAIREVTLTKSGLIEYEVLHFCNHLAVVSDEDATEGIIHFFNDVWMHNEGAYLLSFLCKDEMSLDVWTKKLQPGYTNVLPMQEEAIIDMGGSIEMDIKCDNPPDMMMKPQRDRKITITKKTARMKKLQRLFKPEPHPSQMRHKGRFDLSYSANVFNAAGDVEEDTSFSTLLNYKWPLEGAKEERPSSEEISRSGSASTPGTSPSESDSKGGASGVTSPDKSGAFVSGSNIHKMVVLSRQIDVIGSAQYRSPSRETGSQTVLRTSDETGNRAADEVGHQRKKQGSCREQNSSASTSQQKED